MRYLINILKSEWTWVAVFTAILYFFTVSPIIHNFQVAPVDRWYWGAEEYPLDFTGNLGYVQEGYHGDWLARFNYSTTLPDGASIVKIEYILIGQFARVFGFTPITGYIFIRALLSFIYLGSIYFLICEIFKKKLTRIVAYAFILFGAGITFAGEQGSFVMKGAYDQMVFTRFTSAMPHYLLGGLATILSLLFLSRALRQSRVSQNFWIALIFGAVGSFVYAPDAVLALSGFPLFIGYQWIIAKAPRKELVYFCTILTCYVLASSVPILYVHHVVTTVWQGINTAHLEELYPFRLSFLDYLRALGLAYVFSWVGIAALLKKRMSLVFLFLATWVIMHPVGEFFFSDLLHINRVRYFMTPYPVAFGIVGAWGVEVIIDYCQKQLKIIRRYSIAIFFMFLLIVSGWQTYQMSYSRQHLCFCLPDFYDFGYPTRSSMAAIDWLNASTKPSDVVLSTYYAGTLISTFSGNKVYVSWWMRLIEPKNGPEVEQTLAHFYEHRMTDAEAKQFLIQEHIRYVYYGQEERVWTKQETSLPYSFLTPVFSKGDTVIYKYNE